MPMITKTVEVTVCMEVDRTQPNGHRLLHIKVGDNPPAQLPKDVPAPRRLVQELLTAALAKG